MNTHDQAFYALWHQHFKSYELRRYCLRFLRDEAEAELACMRTMDRARQGFGRMQETGRPIANFRAWVYAIVRNEALRGLDYLQRRQLQGVADGTEKSTEQTSIGAEPTAVPPLLEEAFRRNLINQNEYDVIRYDLSGLFKDRLELAEFLGLSRSNCDVLHLRGIRKLVRGVFTHFVRYLGGPDAVAEVFQHALQHPPPSFTKSEIVAFTEVVLKRNTRFRPEGEALQSACQKMVGLPTIRSKFLF